MEYIALLRLFIFILFIFIFISSIISWINRSKIAKLRLEIISLKKIIHNFTKNDSKKEKIPELAIPESVQDGALEKQKAKSNSNSSLVAAEKTKIDIPITKELGNKNKLSLEQKFGQRLPIWVGGIALALSGLFLAKYSIENSTLTPRVRMSLGALFSFGLIYAAEYIRKHQKFSGQTKIYQSLSGAGIVVIYFILFSSAKIHGLIPVYFSFALMALLTMLSVLLSLKHGAPIALFGLIGGFLTPALMSTGSGSGLFLFSYLYLIIGALMIIIRKQKWWWLSIPTIFGSILWVLVWMMSEFTPNDSTWLLSFLLALTATIIYFSQSDFNKENKKLTIFSSPISIINFIGITSNIALIGFVSVLGNMGFLDWGLLALMCIAGLILAFFNTRLYGFVPLLSLAITISILFWSNANYNVITTAIIAFATIYGVLSHFALTHSKKPILWAFISVLSIFGYYVLSYYKLQDYSKISYLWGVLACVIVGYKLYILNQLIVRKPFDKKRMEILLTIFSASPAAFFALAVLIELDREFLSLTFAFEILVISWINNRVKMLKLEPIITALGILFIFILFSQLILMFVLIVYSLFEAIPNIEGNIPPIIKWPLLQLTVPAFMMISSANLLMKKHDGKIVFYLELAFLVLISLSCYYLIRHLLHIDENILLVGTTFFERGVITNILFLFGLLALWVAKRYGRHAFMLSGQALCLIAIFRICYFDILFSNPILKHHLVGNLPLLNSLITNYLLPAGMIYILYKKFDFPLKHSTHKYFAYLFSALIFIYLNLNLRQFYQGEYLDSSVTSNAEIYTYSLAWLLIAITLLFAGILKQNQMIRHASLALMIITVLKVFLFDTSNLEGLYRIISFFGLGVALICLSYLYGRFVFTKKS